MFMKINKIKLMKIIKWTMGNKLDSGMDKALDSGGLGYGHGLPLGHKQGM